MKIFVAKQNSDLTEGRGPAIPIGYFLSREVAEWVNAKAPGVFGTKNDCRVEVIEVCESKTLQEYEGYCKEEEKRKALSKLTEKEKELLGL